MILYIVNGALLGFVIGTAFVHLTSVRYWREAAEAWERAAGPHAAPGTDGPRRLRVLPRDDSKGDAS